MPLPTLNRSELLHRITRYTLPAALCVSLLTVSPALAGAADAPTKAAPPAAKKAIPGAEALTAQVESLGPPAA